MTQLWLDSAPTWFRVDKFDRRAAALADRHYSRQSVGSDQCLAPGETLLMLTPDWLATWGVVHNFDPGHDDTRRWRCSIFRNESTSLSSALIIVATDATFDYWPRRYRRVPDVPLSTEVDPHKTRRKRDPGRCFRRAGWELWRKNSRGLYLFVAPGERARLNIQGPVLR